MTAPSMRRLTAVELRKMTDTRSGRWLLIIVALAAVAMVGVVIFAAKPGDRTLKEMFVASQTGVGILLPILGILAVTSEWSQRTNLTTFALVPERHRVAGAKMFAGAVLAAAAVIVGGVTAVVGRALAGMLGRADGGWTFPPSLIGTLVLAAAIGVLAGVAFGMIFMNSPLAIVLFILVPTGWTALGETVKAFNRPADWLDQNRTMNALYGTGMTGEEWAKVGTSTALWLLLPLIAGVIRLARRDLK
jgi:ABC-2 type transport system permease protein